MREFWLGMRDLNPLKQSQSLSCCRYTNSQSVLFLPFDANHYSTGFFVCQGLFLIFLCRRAKVFLRPRVGGRSRRGPHAGTEIGCASAGGRNGKGQGGNRNRRLFGCLCPHGIRGDAFAGADGCGGTLRLPGIWHSAAYAFLKKCRQ